MAMSSRRIDLTVTENEEKIQYPPSARCPITQSKLQSPVVLETGHSYEEREIKKWLSLKNTCPLTGMELISKSFVANHALKNIIEEYKDFIKEYSDALVKLQHMEEIQAKLVLEERRNKRLRLAHFEGNKRIGELEEQLAKEQECSRRLQNELEDSRKKLIEYKQSEPTLEVRQKNAFEQLQAGANPNDEFLKATKQGKYTDARIWCALGADKDVRDAKTGETALIMAVKQNNKQLIQALCQKENADVNLADDNGDTALHFALTRYNTWAIKFLLAAAANIHLSNKSGKTPDQIGTENFNNCWAYWKKKREHFSFFAPKSSTFIESETISLKDKLQKGY